MSFNFSPKIVTEGLVLYLDAANTKSYISGSNVWGDISRTGVIGTLTNGPTFSSINGGAITFDGINDYITIPYNSSLAFSTAFTLSIWVRILSFSSAFIGLIVTGRDTGAWYGIWYNNGAFLMATSGSNLVSPNTVINNKWYNLVYTASGSSRLLYEDGVIVRSGSYSAPSIQVGSSFFIGSATAGMEYSNSNISLALKYNRALTQQEVLQNYNSLKGRFGL